MNYTVEISNLEKNYENFSLKIDELKLQSGLITGLIGENGAGKTTLIKCMLNIINKNNGSIKIFGKDSKESELDIKEDIGVVLDNSFFADPLNAKDINSIMKDIYKNWDSELFFNYLKEFGINEKQVLKKLSKGMKKKVEIATALSHHPKLLILDEPTSGLDPIVRNEVLDIFLNFIQDDEHSILLSTHITTDLEHIADNIVFIDHGRLILDKSKDDILDNYGILKCNIDEFEKIDQSDIVSSKKNKYDYQILVNNINHCKNKYPSMVIDKITLEDLMLLIIKGGK